MKSELYVGTGQLHDLCRAISHFSGHAQGTLQAVETEVRAALERLAIRRQQAHSEVLRCRKAHESAVDIVARREAAIKLRAAESALHVLHRKHRGIEEAYAAYRIRSRNLREWIDRDLPNAQAFLTGKQQALAQYQRVSTDTD